MSRLDEIKARCDAATEGPWQWRNSNGEPMLLSRAPGLYVVMTFERMGMHGAQPVFRDPENPNVLKPAGRENIYEFSDAEFIAAAREDVPWLLAEVERLTAERDALAAKVARVEALAEEWRYKGQFGWGAWQLGEGPDPEGYVMDHCASALRDALAGSEADTSDTQPTDQEVK